jgi:pimeloyl-ACP methyl ester carboxylesterase
VVLPACVPEVVAPTPPTGVSTSTAPPATAEPTLPPPAPARWSDCGGGYQCAKVRVPRDYADPSIGYLDVALTMLPADDRERRIGALLVNPGGPGGSGIDLVRDSVDAFPHLLRRRFDLVGFDPRGVNNSTAVRCIDNLDPRAQLDPSPDDEAELRALVDDARTYANACGDRNPDLLPYLSTAAVVQDLNRIRVALGEEKLTYLGFSYGTMIGALYADAFPENVRALALDGAMDPSLSLLELRADQARSFEDALGRFLDDCQRRRGCLFNHGNRTRQAFDRLMLDIDKSPLRAVSSNDPRKVGPGLAWGAILGTMYAEAAWPALEWALFLAERGDGSGFLALSDPYRGRDKNGAYSNFQDAYTSNICLDYPSPTQIDDYTDLARSLTDDAPRFGQFVAYNDLPCAFWPARATGDPARVTGAGAPPIVVIGTTGDPATPMSWSRSLVDQLESAVLITHEGNGHTAFGVNDCVREAVKDYLIDLDVPRNGLVCD